MESRTEGRIEVGKWLTNRTPTLTLNNYETGSFLPKEAKTNPHIEATSQPMVSSEMVCICVESLRVETNQLEQIKSSNKLSNLNSKLYPLC